MISDPVNALAERVVNWSIGLGVIAVLCGIVLGIMEVIAERQVKEAALAAAQDTKAVAPSGAKAGDAQAQSGLSTAVSAVAELAKALKDLERSARLLIVGLAFFAVAAVAAGADAIG